ncbi:hypothetical protein CEXT_638191 [Caerostris extrusa]|uniref:Uncharacterized protein n=1 Tax=Caerostris extrusa TaxID=172846 RepID=A0AAV4UTC2_CAEEX|nr:hypothetical protein CEXT_638191 [Caerostris extrusa]
MIIFTFRLASDTSVVAILNESAICVSMYMYGKCAWTNLPIPEKLLLADCSGIPSQRLTLTYDQVGMNDGYECGTVRCPFCSDVKK